MQSVRVHLDGNGVLWAIAKCRICGEVQQAGDGRGRFGPCQLQNVQSPNGSRRCGARRPWPSRVNPCAVRCVVLRARHPQCGCDWHCRKRTAQQANQ